ncbi:MAG: dihydroxyacetone kinase phosphoryl donor subunit DhaM [Cardiobacteriaceae bacterium]|nr:dihydroxyacetone kinase phosphoryl donor subunit DhaM [Cardiobacteriaceae bacterium]
MIGLVLVSHSPKIAEGLADLIREMANCPLALAAGIDDPEHPIGTDAVKIMQAVEEVMSDDGVVILVDLGSAILSAQTALDLLAPEMAEKVSIAAAPLVEGALSAAITASAGADRVTVVREAESALNAKYEALGRNLEPTSEIAEPSAFSHHEQSLTVKLTPPHGLHARPAAKIVATLRPFEAKMRLSLAKNGKTANAKSMTAIMTLGAVCGDELTLFAEGSDANQALQAFKSLADEHFGDTI